MANMGYDDQMLSQTPHAGMSERVHSPWAGDYDLPPSVDPVSLIFQIASQLINSVVTLKQNTLTVVLTIP